MSIRKYAKLMGIALCMGLFSSCDALEGLYDDPTVEQASNQYYIDCTEYDQWVYVKFHENGAPTITTSKIDVTTYEETGAPTDWDIAQHRYDVKTNGAKVYKTDYHSIDELVKVGLPAVSQWTEDEYSDKSISIDMSRMMEGIIVYAPGYKNALIGEWVEVDTSSMPPNYTMHDNVYVVQLKDGTYLSIQLANFMSTDKYQVKGWMTVNYKYPI